MQERRLRELRGESLAQRAVEHRVARGIREIGEDDGTLAGEFRPAMRKEISARGEPRLRSRLAAAMSGQRLRGATFERRRAVAIATEAEVGAPAIAVG